MFRFIFYKVATFTLEKQNSRVLIIFNSSIGAKVISEMEIFISTLFFSIISVLKINIL